MIGRCENFGNAKYPDYGGRGIAVCRRWRQSFAAFLADVGKRPDRTYSLDRVENDRGYEPGNVRWSNREDQQRNTRRNRLVTHHGESRPLVEWVELYGLDYHVAYDRLTRGWTPERAFSTPVTRKRARRQG